MAGTCEARTKRSDALQHPCSAVSVCSPGGGSWAHKPVVISMGYERQLAVLTFSAQERCVLRIPLAAVTALSCITSGCEQRGVPLTTLSLEVKPDEGLDLPPDLGPGCGCLLQFTCAASDVADSGLWQGLHARAAAAPHGVSVGFPSKWWEVTTVVPYVLRLLGRHHVTVRQQYSRFEPLLNGVLAALAVHNAVVMLNASVPAIQAVAGKVAEWLGPVVTEAVEAASAYLFGWTALQLVLGSIMTRWSGIFMLVGRIFPPLQWLISFVWRFGSTCWGAITLLGTASWSVVGPVWSMVGKAGYALSHAFTGLVGLGSLLLSAALNSGVSLLLFLRLDWLWGVGGALLGPVWRKLRVVGGLFGRLGRAVASVGVPLRRLVVGTATALAGTLAGTAGLIGALFHSFGAGLLGLVGGVVALLRSFGAGFLSLVGGFMRAVWGLMASVSSSLSGAAQATARLVGKVWADCGAAASKLSDGAAACVRVGCRRTVTSVTEATPAPPSPRTGCCGFLRRLNATKPIVGQDDADTLAGLKNAVQNAASKAAGPAQRIWREVSPTRRRSKAETRNSAAVGMIVTAVVSSPAAVVVGTAAAGGSDGGRRRSRRLSRPRFP